MAVRILLEHFLSVLVIACLSLLVKARLQPVNCLVARVGFHLRESCRRVEDQAAEIALFARVLLAVPPGSTVVATERQAPQVCLVYLSGEAGAVHPLVVQLTARRLLMVRALRHHSTGVAVVLREEPRY